MLNKNVVATDATTVTVNGKQNYIRNFSISDTVVYRAMQSKSIDALKKLEFLKNMQEYFCMTMKQRCIILEQIMPNVMYTSSGICAKIQKKQKTAGQRK